LLGEIMSRRVPSSRIAKRSRRRHRSLTGKTVDEFCAAYDVSPATFYRWKLQGNAPAVWQPGGPGGRQIITPESEDAWKRAHTALAAAIDAAE
jgi:hypothetical protein